MAIRHAHSIYTHRTRETPKHSQTPDSHRDVLSACPCTVGQETLETEFLPSAQLPLSVSPQFTSGLFFQKYKENLSFHGKQSVCSLFVKFPLYESACGWVGGREPLGLGVRVSSDMVMVYSKMTTRADLPSCESEMQLPHLEMRVLVVTSRETGGLNEL